jgi:serine/threonine-protein kinase
MTDCPDDEAIANLSAGALDEEERAALTAHIDVCAACRILVADAARARASVADIEAAPRRPRAAPGLAEALIGATLDRKYQLVGLIGEGGMGSVYEARHVGTSRRVAVKLIRPDKLAPGGAAESRFRREARAAGAIRSPNIVEILDAGTDEATGHLYLVMEHLSGGDLKHLLDRAGSLSWEVALRIAGQALAGLAKAHAAGVVHRDIKPANLFLAREDDGTVTVKVLDFGVAKVRPDPLRGPETMSLTDTGGFVGSPLYMSPEQVQSSKNVDARADVWSLGCVLYAAMAGRAPHQHIESFARLVIAICGAAAPPLGDVAPGVPEEVAALVHRALAIDPEDRTPSAATMLEELRALLPGGLALHEEMLPDHWPESNAGSARADTTTGGPFHDGGSADSAGSAPKTPERSRSAGPWTPRRRALVVLVAVLALGIGSTLGYGLTLPARGVATAPPPPIPPAPSDASVVVTGTAASQPAVSAELSARPELPPSATAPSASAVSKTLVGARVVKPSVHDGSSARSGDSAGSAPKPPAAAVLVAPPTSPPQRTADPLIPADPP